LCTSDVAASQSDACLVMQTPIAPSLGQWTDS
jgi:hypothetical protein